MMNQKMTKAGKVLFLGSLLMTSVGLSPRHLMLASNDDVQSLSLATVTAPPAPTEKSKVTRKTIGGKLFVITPTEETASEEYLDADDGNKLKSINRTKVSYRQESTITEACVECLQGTATIVSDKKSASLDLGDVEKAITAQLNEAKVKKLKAEQLVKEEEAKKDYKTCAKIPPAIKKLHDDDNVARAACYLMAADEAYRKDGNINSSFHWLELRKQIASAALSKRSEDRAFMATLESWASGSRMQLTDDKMVSEIAPSLVTEIKDSVVGNKKLATYEARNEAIARQLQVMDRQFEAAERRYEAAQEREVEAMKDPRCSYNFMCWSRYHGDTQNAMTAVDKVRNGAGKYENMMMKINPRTLAGFEAQRPGEGGILAADMENYYRRFSANAHELVDYTQNYSWLNQFDYDDLQNQGRRPYEMVGARDPYYGLQTPIVGQGVAGNLNFAGRVRGGSGGMPNNMLAGGGRSNVNSASAFTSMQAFGGQAFGGLNNRPYTGVNLGIPYNFNSSATQYSPGYQPQPQMPMFQQQQVPSMRFVGV